MPETKEGVPALETKEGDSSDPKFEFRNSVTVQLAGASWWAGPEFGTAQRCFSCPVGLGVLFSRGGKPSALSACRLTPSASFRLPCNRGGERAMAGWQRGEERGHGHPVRFAGDQLRGEDRRQQHPWPAGRAGQVEERRQDATFRPWEERGREGGGAQKGGRFGNRGRDFFRGGPADGGRGRGAKQWQPSFPQGNHSSNDEPWR
jgi:hypothetical protein